MKNESIYDRIVLHLFHSGDAVPGARVVETQLAAHLGVSRIPVREALGRLRGQGLLVSDGKGQGMRLRECSPGETMQLYEYRELLEGAAARAAALHATQRDVARLSELADHAADIAARGGFEYPEWREADHAFHAALADASHNDRINRSMKTLLAEMHGLFYGEIYRRLERARGRKVSRAEAFRHAGVAMHEHAAVLAAISARDPKAAERRARYHVRRASYRIRKAMVAFAQASKAAATCD